MAKSKISLGKCHITLENMRVIFSYLLILISNIISYSDKRTDTMISILLEHEISVPCFMSLICSSVTWFIVYGNLNRIYILQLCENYINLNYVELVHSAFSSTVSFYWRRKWQPTPVFLPGESHGQRSLEGYSPWDRKSWTRLSN